MKNLFERVEDNQIINESIEGIHADLVKKETEIMLRKFIKDYRDKNGKAPSKEESIAHVKANWTTIENSLRKRLGLKLK